MLFIGRLEGFFYLRCTELMYEFPGEK